VLCYFGEFVADVFIRVARLGKKSANWATLAAIGTLKFGFGVLLIFVLLFKTLATTLGDLGRLEHFSCIVF